MSRRLILWIVWLVMIASSLLFMILAFVAHSAVGDTISCNGATDADQCSTAFEYPQTILLVVAVVTALAVIPTSLMSLFILLHRTVFGVKANVRWTLMVVIGSYTGFILMGNSIVIYYIYEYFKYYVDNNLAYTTGASVKETWDDNACKSKFM